MRNKSFWVILLSCIVCIIYSHYKDILLLARFFKISLKNFT
nr:MAG TPA: holin [Caudoviricetes sp.]